MREKTRPDRLKTRKRRLAAAFRALRKEVAALEEALGDCNRKLMRADLLSMELEQVFDSSTDPMWVVREDGVVVRANRAMVDFFGMPARELVGRLCKDVFGTHCASGGKCPVKTCKRARTFHNYEIERPLSSGETRHFLVSTASLITIDGLSGFVAQYKDITPLKTAEKMMEKANAELERLAGIDGLTGAYNRRSFDAALKREWERLAREGACLSVIMADIDHFKEYNDACGHQAGDECLKKVAEALALSAGRPSDLLARYGGEEFAFLLPKTPADGARIVAENARKNVAALELPHPASSPGPRVSISLGAACVVPVHGESPGSLVERADESLYRAKASGRNTVICAGAPPSGEPA